jgi:hypothetical protein
MSSQYIGFELSGVSSCLGYKGGKKKLKKLNESIQVYKMINNLINK